MRRQRTQPRRKLKTQVGTPTQRSPGGFGGIESGLRRSSALTFCRPFEAAEHVERRRWSNDGVEREAATTTASEATYLENAPKQICPSVPSRSANDPVVRDAVLVLGRDERGQPLGQLHLALDEVCGPVRVRLSQGEDHQSVLPTMQSAPP